MIGVQEILEDANSPRVICVMETWTHYEDVGAQATLPALSCRSQEYLERALFAQLEAVPKARQQCLAAGN